MISFYPGPSQVDSKVPKYVKEAYEEGYLGINHRSEMFVQMVAKTQKILRKKLNIPKNYQVAFVSSATECWEIVAQSLTAKGQHHVYNGAFGLKWMKNSKMLGVAVSETNFDHNTELDSQELKVPTKSDTICLTQNETSNGTQLDNGLIRKIRKEYPNHLIAVDATSSLGGAQLKFKDADIWFASVQKCLGLPAGMALIIFSESTVARAKSVDERNHYNSFLAIAENVEKRQTTHTPNVLDIYLLMRVLEKRQKIEEVDQLLAKRMNSLLKVLKRSDQFQPLLDNEKVQSKTVLAVAGKKKKIQALKSAAEKNGFVLGNGYGEFKDNTFRIANFPAIEGKQFKSFLKFLKSRI